MCLYITIMDYKDIYNDLITIFIVHYYSHIQFISIIYKYNFKWGIWKMYKIIIWKSDLSTKIKQDFFQAVVVSIVLYGCTWWTLTKYREKGRCELYKNATCWFEQILKTAPYKTEAGWPLVSHLTNHSRQTTYRTLQEKQG